MAIRYGNSLSNTLYGTSRADTIYGYGGNDTVYASSGNDKRLWRHRQRQALHELWQRHRLRRLGP